eukprot:COSAG02_NODE_1861_length_10613_cov_3.797033_14_plen_78_part_00
MTDAAFCTQIQLDHGFVVGVQPDSPWVIVSGTNPNEDEPQLDPGATSSGTGKHAENSIKWTHAHVCWFVIHPCCGLL